MTPGVVARIELGARCAPLRRRLRRVIGAARRRLARPPTASPVNSDRSQTCFFVSRMRTGAVYTPSRLEGSLPVSASESLGTGLSFTVPGDDG